MAEIEDPKKQEEREKKRKKNLTILILLLILLVLLLCCLIGAPWRGYWFIGDLMPSPEPQKAVATILPTAVLTELPDVKIVTEIPTATVKSTEEETLVPTETPKLVMTPLPVSTPKLSGGMVAQYLLDAIPTKESVETMNIPKLWEKESYPIVAAELTERGLEFPLGVIGRYVDQSTVAYLCHKDYVSDDGEVLYDACGILYVLQKGDSVYINGVEYVVTGKTSVMASKWWETVRGIPMSISSCAPGYDREKKEYTHRLVVTIEKR